LYLKKSIIWWLLHEEIGAGYYRTGPVVLHLWVHGKQKFRWEKGHCKRESIRLRLTTLLLLPLPFSSLSLLCLIEERCGATLSQIAESSSEEA
jgi:hypothetical protein